MGRGCLAAVLMIGAAACALWAAFLYVLDLPTYHEHPFHWGPITPYLLAAALLGTVAVRIGFRR